MELLTKPLTSSQIQSKHSVKEAYGDFWNSIKFRKGWEHPHLKRSDLDHLLDSAAEIVVRIRTLLDAENPGFKMRMVDGSGREFLWTCEHDQKSPEENPDKFVRDLVHSTFRDANGYVEGLTEERVEEFINIIQEFKKSQNDEGNLPSYIQANWKLTQDLMQEWMNSKSFEGSSLSTHQLESIRKVIKKMNELNDQICHVMEKPKEQLPVPPSVADLSTPRDPEPENSEEISGGEISSEEGYPTGTSDLGDPQVLMEEITRPSEKNNVDIEELQNEVNNVDMSEEPKEPPLSTSESPPEEDPPKEEEDPSTRKIEVLAEDISHIRPKIKSLQLEADNIQPQALLEDPGKSLEELKQLRKKCVGVSEGLMQDLLQLDAISTSAASRPLRKQQVKTIQSMMDDVDAIQSKLKNFEKTIQSEYDKIKEKEEEERKQREEEEKKRKAEEEKLRQQKEEEEKKQRQLQMEEEGEEEGEEEEEGDVMEEEEETSKKRKFEEAQSAIVPPPRRSTPDPIAWSKLKFEPKMEVSEAHDKYIIASYIPGMREEDIHINLSKNRENITIEGVRVPTDEEMEKMKYLVLNKIKQNPRYARGIQEQDIKALLLKTGAGRYGKFSETYRLPPSVDVNNISAQYKGGVLQIEIPKIMRRAYTPRRSPYGAPANFFGDNDFWW